MNTACVDTKLQTINAVLFEPHGVQFPRRIFFNIITWMHRKDNTRLSPVAFTFGKDVWINLRMEVSRHGVQRWISCGKGYLNLKRQVCDFLVAQVVIYYNNTEQHFV